MDQPTFVALLDALVLDSLPTELLASWETPPGRLCTKQMLERSNWVSQLEPIERDLLEAFGHDAARSAVFGVLAVLDGARTSGEPSAGHLELRYVTTNRSDLLASSAPDMPVPPLHELLP